MNLRLRFIVTLICYLAAGLAMAADSSNTGNVNRESPPAKLSSGSYKFAGQCSKLTKLSHDITTECGNYLAIIAKNPEMPTFIIPLKVRQAAWQYITDKPGTMSPDGKQVSYPVGALVDMSANMQYTYPGECVMSVRRGEPLLHCTMWRDESRGEIVREIIFEGTGNWVFDKRTPY